MKKKLFLAGMLALALTFGLALAGCDMDLGSSGSGSGGGGGGGGNSSTYTYYFVNNSSYTVSVTIGGESTDIYPGYYDYITLTTSITTFTYSPGNLVKYTGSLTGTVTFTNRY